MPLNSRKSAWIVANRALLRAGRAIAVAAVRRTAYGGTLATSVPVVLKAQGSTDPPVLDATGAPAAEYLAELPIEVDPRPIAYLALTGGATDSASIASAIQLEIVQYRQSGLAPDRWQLTLRRLR